MVPRIPHTWRSQPFPYDVLDGTGIDPLCSQEEVLDRALALQSLGQFTPEFRRSWDLLRTPQERLAVDFFLIHEALSRPEELLLNSLSSYSE
jgi:hypothetical protein